MEIETSIIQIAKNILSLYRQKNKNTDSGDRFFNGIYVELMSVGVGSITAEKTLNLVVSRIAEFQVLTSSKFDFENYVMLEKILTEAVRVAVFSYHPEIRIKRSDLKKITDSASRLAERLEYANLELIAQRRLAERIAPVVHAAGFLPSLPSMERSAIQPVSSDSFIDPRLTKLLLDKRTRIHFLSNQKHVALPLQGWLKKIALDLSRADVQASSFTFSAFKLYLVSKDIYTEKEGGFSSFSFLSNGSGDSVRITMQELHREMIGMFYKNIIPAPGRRPTPLATLHNKLRAAKEDAVKHLGLITRYHEGSNELQPLLFEFIGVCDARTLGSEDLLVFEFFLQGHPRFKTPSFVESVVKHKGKSCAFGIFFATQRCNPDVTSGVHPDSFIAEYLEKYPFLKPVKEWKNWSEVVQHYACNDPF